MEGIQFIKDDIASEREENIKALLSLLDEKPISNEVFKTKRFMVAAMYAAKTLKENKAELERKQKETQAKAMPRIMNKVDFNLENQHIATIEVPAINQQIKQMQENEELDIPQPPEIPEIIEEAAKEEIEDIKGKQEYALILSSSQVLAKAIIDLENGKMKYKLIEPIIDERILKKTIDLLGRKLKKDVNVIKDDKLLIKIIKKACKKYKIDFTNNYFENIKYYLYRDNLHFGKIDPLLMDNKIKSITCEGVNKPIIAEYNSQRFETNIVFESNEEINNLLFKIAKMVKVDLSTKNPVLNTSIGNLKIEAALGMEEISSRFIIRKPC